MLNNIKISQTTNEIILNVNVIADIKEILEELDERLPKLKSFYQTSKIPIRVTGRLFTDSEIEKVKRKIRIRRRYFRRFAYKSRNNKCCKRRNEICYRR